MIKSDGIWRDVIVAGSLLSRLPLPAPPQQAFARAHQAVWAYPLVGFVVAGIALAGAQVAAAFGAPANVAAGLMLGLMMVLTGAMHEDGLADCADGFWGGWTRERRLGIMKDSQTGTYGVLALVMVTGLRWICMAALFQSAPLWLLIAPMLSRAVMPAIMAGLPHARKTGLSQSVGRPGWGITGVGFALALLAALLLAGGYGVVLALVAGAVAAICARIAQRKISGQTGDVMGATQQIVETALLILLMSFAA